MSSHRNIRRLVAALVAASSVASARPVTFAVVGFGQQCAVKIAGTTHRLNAPWRADPYYNGTIDVPANAKTYKYVIDGKPEAFDRVLEDGVSKTLNEFYGREVTYQQMPQFKSPFPDKIWTRGARADIFDGGYIPTVHFSGANAENYIVTAQDANVDVLFVGPNQAMKYKQVYASAKNDEFAKAQLKVDFDGEDFYGRSTIKLRNSEFDATMMREHLYSEMLRAAGAPALETNKARVYYNKKPYGLLELQDVAADEGFIKKLFYGKAGRTPNPIGIPLDCSTGADFTPNGPYDAFQQMNEGRKVTNSRVALLSKALAKLDVTNKAAVAEFDKSWFDIDSFFKAMAMEYLAGHWDSYWYFTTNFVVYDDPTESSKGKAKFYFIDQDFDQTFGVAFGAPYTNAGLQATSESYKDLLTRKWKLDEFDAVNRTMVTKLVKSPSILAGRFEKILTGIVTNIFNPDAVTNKLAALKERYRPEIEWDRTLKRPHAGKSEWTLQDFDQGFDSPVGPIEWGLTQWVKERATAVAAEFNFEWDQSPLPVVYTLGKPLAAAVTSEAADPDAKSGGNPSGTAGGDSSSGVLVAKASAGKTFEDSSSGDSSSGAEEIEIAGDEDTDSIPASRVGTGKSAALIATTTASSASSVHAVGVSAGAVVALVALLHRA